MENSAELLAQNVLNMIEYPGKCSQSLYLLFLKYGE